VVFSHIVLTVLHGCLYFCGPRRLVAWPNYARGGQDGLVCRVNVRKSVKATTAPVMLEGVRSEFVSAYILERRGMVRILEVR